MRGPIAAICVQDFDARGVVQFTIINTVGCALHRYTSRVIHHSKFVILQDAVSSDPVALFARHMGWLAAHM